MSGRAGSVRIARLTPLLGTVLIFGALLGLLQIAGVREIGGVGILPTTSDIAAALQSILTEEATYTAIRNTMVPWAVGFVIASGLGIAVGLIVGLSDFAFRSTRGIFDFLRATPAIAFLPLAVLVMGTGGDFKVVLIVVSAVWVVLLQSTAGLRSVDSVAVDSARSLRMSRWHRIWWVLLPGMLPFILTGMRVAALQAFLVCIGVELIAGSEGLGQEILFRQMGANIPELWAFVAVAAALGLLVSLVLNRAEAWLLRWHVSQRELGV